MRNGDVILLTGTPGTGKSTTAARVAKETGMVHVNVSDWVKEKGLHDGWDDEYKCYMMNDEKLCDALEDLVQKGGIVLDFHCSDIFPEDWIDHVFVLMTDNTVLYSRLEDRGYPERKLRENVEAEIMQVILEETRGSYALERITEMQSDTPQELEANVASIVDWIHSS